MKIEDAIRCFRQRMPGVTMKGTVDLYETAIEALEKRIPKRVNKASKNKLNTNLCPMCSREVRIRQFYCETCGQKLNWD